MHKGAGPGFSHLYNSLIETETPSINCSGNASCRPDEEPGVGGGHSEPAMGEPPLGSLSTLSPTSSHMVSLGTEDRLCDSSSHPMSRLSHTTTCCIPSVPADVAPSSYEGRTHGLICSVPAYNHGAGPEHPGASCPTPLAQALTLSLISDP